MGILVAAFIFTVGAAVMWASRATSTPFETLVAVSVLNITLESSLKRHELGIDLCVPGVFGCLCVCVCVCVCVLRARDDHVYSAR